MPQDSLSKLHAISLKISQLNHIHSALYLDQELATPPKGLSDKADQIALIHGLIHKESSNPEISSLLKEVSQLPNPSDEVSALIRIMSKTHREATAIPEDFVQQKSQLDSHSLEAWKKARTENDFSQFQPFLEKQVEMSRLYAGYLGFSDNPYEGLLDIYEPGSSTTMYDELYTPLKAFLIDAIPQIVAKQNANAIRPLSFEGMDQARQESFARYLLNKIGYDFDQGRLVTTTHPYTINLGFNDVRLSTRYDPDDIEFISSVIHEGGHALYEQGIAPHLKNGILADGTSMGFHESQSRIMEVFAGQANEFWTGVFPELVKEFPNQMNGVSLIEWTNGLRYVAPSKIRVQADPVTYGLHVIIRYELEKDLISGALQVKDLPEAWNHKYKEYLGVTIVNDSEGCLQDIHWSDGSFGYFPTYSYGTTIAAQIWHHYKTQNPQWKTEFQQGNYLGLREWLRDNFHQFGSVYQTQDLVLKSLGEQVSSEYFVNEIRNTFLA